VPSEFDAFSLSEMRNKNISKFSICVIGNYFFKFLMLFLANHKMVPPKMASALTTSNEFLIRLLSLVGSIGYC